MNPMVSMYDLDPFLLNTFCLFKVVLCFCFHVLVWLMRKLKEEKWKEFVNLEFLLF